MQKRQRTLSLTEIVRAASSPAQPVRQRLARRRPDPPPPALQAGGSDIAHLDAGLARVEMATAALRESLALLRQKNAESAHSSVPPTVLPSDNRIGYRLAEAAKILGVSPRALRREVALGHIPHRACGRITIISATALEAYARGETTRGRLLDAIEHNAMPEA